MKLKSCPWCGIIPRIWNDSQFSNYDQWKVECVNNICVIAPSMAKDFEKKEYAIEAWNITKRK